jgi:hypothetical protein
MGCLCFFPAFFGYLDNSGDRRANISWQVLAQIRQDELLFPQESLQFESQLSGRNGILSDKVVNRLQRATYLVFDFSSRRAHFIEAGFA